jgi:hypothetical protein
MSQDKIDKCMRMALDSDATKGEAISAFLMARNLINSGKGVLHTPTQSSTPPPTSRNKNNQLTTTVTSSALVIFQIIHFISKYGYAKDIGILINMGGTVRNPSITVTADGSKEQLNAISDIIKLVYNSDK